jgi:serine/threonine-protein kinase
MRFGEKAIELKVLTIEQVEEALAAQEDGRKRGIDRSIGAWLHDRGILDLVQVQRIMSAASGNAAGRIIPDIDLVALLGRGASGAVYRGRSIAMGIDVAVKIRAPRRETDDPNAQRFKLEAKLGERLAHPNIVRLFSAGETRDYTYHVLEYVEGTALDVMLRNEGKLPEAFVLDVGAQICAALECAAREGIVHRDIKPANILITHGGRAKLCDLGLAKDLNRGTALTADGVLLGSPFYLAPEYARTGEIEIRSDIYSLGVTLYHCATGYVPFPGKSAMEILQRVVRDTPPDPRTYNPALSEGCALAILKMIARDLSQRFQTPTEAKDALVRLASGQGTASQKGDTGFGRLLGFFKRK